MGVCDPPPPFYNKEKEPVRAHWMAYHNASVNMKRGQWVETYSGKTTNYKDQESIFASICAKNMVYLANGSQN